MLALEHLLGGLLGDTVQCVHMCGKGFEIAIFRIGNSLAMKSFSRMA